MPEKNVLAQKRNKKNHKAASCEISHFEELLPITKGK
jgi:hypothetical protein